MKFASWRTPERRHLRRRWACPGKQRPGAGSSQPSLKDLLERHGTDKVVYASAYELLLQDRRASVRGVLEVGIGTLVAGAHSSMLGYAKPHYRQGGSLRAWRDYFPGAPIVGIDVQADTQLAAEPRIHTWLCDSTSPTGVENCLSPYQTSGFDLIVDDGSHDGRDQLGTIANLFPYLNSRSLSCSSPRSSSVLSRRRCAG